MTNRWIETTIKDARRNAIIIGVYDAISYAD
jgi:hypothetical protein